MARRVALRIGGLVQGVGFRPFVWRLAQRHRLAGSVCNTPAGVLVEAEGSEAEIALFLQALREEAPPLATISSFSVQHLSATGERGFAIAASGGGDAEIEISPDWDVCPDCLAELFDPTNRRFRYPFITCTNCGPRYSIVTGVPYDRPRTTMSDFPLCPLCRAEYENPADRRFHAQPLACPDCGPSLRLFSPSGEELPGEPVATAAALLRRGSIGAVKGTGGYHLAADPFNDAAVAELRKRKRRVEKPFALLAAGLPEAGRLVRVDQLAARLLTAPEKPIVLLEKLEGSGVAENVAPAIGSLGIMLPSTPLQHLLLGEGFPALVMTSGNPSGEPVIHREDEALGRLSGIADFFLVHDRRIHTRSDDSVIRPIGGHPLVLRRSRGYAPRPVRLPRDLPPVLAAGGELKNTLCLTRGDRAFLSHHLGDLNNPAALQALDETAAHLAAVLAIRPEAVAHDLHPDYLSTRWATALPRLPAIPVQHHHAHLASCIAENGLEGEVIGIVFDGAGFGPDGTVWGGEFLAGGYGGYRRLGHLRRVRLPGGDAAVREPRRMALSWLCAAWGDGFWDLPVPVAAAVPREERTLYRAMLYRGVNSPLTSSCGRLFDAVAAILGVREAVSYEGQAALELEALAEKAAPAPPPYPFGLERGEGTTLDLRPMVRSLVEELSAGAPRDTLARRFHVTLAAGTAETCSLLRGETGLGRVVLSGGVFQNRLLTEELTAQLEKRGFQVFAHRLVPPNDGGLALGQAAVAGFQLRRGREG